MNKEKWQAVCVDGLDEVNYKLHWLDQMERLLGDHRTSLIQHRELIGKLYKAFDDEEIR